MSRARNLATILGSNTALGNLATLNTITDTQIENNAITAPKLHTTSVQDKLGYTPANKAGDTFSGPLIIPNRLRVGRSIYNWYQWGGNPGTSYHHIKTTLWAGGSPNGNSQPTMSLFHIRGYDYDANTIDSMMGFHNWSGSAYSYRAHNAGTRAGAQGAYTSSDGRIVLVINSGGSYPGITIDYHQAFPYDFQDVTVSASSSSSSTSGVY